MKKTKIILLTIGILLLLSSICFAQTPELAWDDIFEKFIGTYDNGSLDTDGAILTDKVPRIIVTCLIVGSAGMLAFGELSATTTTFLRMILLDICSLFQIALLSALPNLNPTPTLLIF